MSIDCATKKLWLAEAQLALHKLMTGTAEVSVSFGTGKSVTYKAADIDKLSDYIADLENQVALCDGRAPARRKPIRFVF